MNQRSYTVIFILLCASILCILAFQGYWIRNFYRQETKSFDHNVYAALEKIAEKIQERKKLQALKMTYIIVNDDTIAKTPSRHMTIATEKNVKIVNQAPGVTTTFSSVSQELNTTVRDSVMIKSENRNTRLIMKGKPGHKAQIIVNDNRKNIKLRVDSDLSNMTKLIDKMITEIKVLDTETENADSLRNLIEKGLKNQGLFLPFEFGIWKDSISKKKIQVQSHGFAGGQKDVYTRDLSADKLINTHEFLTLEFPDRKNYVIAGMKGSLVLSALFSLAILSVFYYVLRLIRNQKKLSEIKNDFVNNMTHELKTPIATISLALDAIGNPLIKNDEVKFTEYKRILKEENEKLNRHVERVLQVALLDKKELQLEKKPVDIAACICTAIDHYKLQIAVVKAVVKFEEPGENILVEGDVEHLCTAFGNLLDNALKYASTAPEIKIRLYRKEDRVFVHILDNGIGIDGTDKEKVFDKFYRVQGGNLHDVKGFGLGLSYVRSVIQAHGGSIELESEKGKGSEFIMELKGVWNF